MATLRRGITVVVVVVVSKSSICSFAVHYLAHHVSQSRIYVTETIETTGCGFHSPREYGSTTIMARALPYGMRLKIPLDSSGKRQDETSHPFCISAKWGDRDGGGATSYFLEYCDSVLRGGRWERRRGRCPEWYHFPEGFSILARSCFHHLSGTCSRTMHKP